MTNNADIYIIHYKRPGAKGSDKGNFPPATINNKWLNILWQTRQAIQYS
jgi:hypothetical protein